MIATGVASTVDVEMLRVISESFDRRHKDGMESASASHDVEVTTQPRS
jgi:hypothetical protein